MVKNRNRLFELFIIIFLVKNYSNFYIKTLTKSDVYQSIKMIFINLIKTTIATAKAHHIPIGLCGQAPSDFPEFTQFLVEQGINSISFTADALLNGIKIINKAEKALMVKRAI